MCRFFIVAGAVGGCTCAGSCESSCTEIMSCIILPWSTFSPNSTHWAFPGCNNPKICSTDNGVYGLGVEVEGLRDNHLELFTLKSSLLSLCSFLELSSRVGSTKRNSRGCFCCCCFGLLVAVACKSQLQSFSGIERKTVRSKLGDAEMMLLQPIKRC